MDYSVSGIRNILPESFSGVVLKLVDIVKSKVLEVELKAKESIDKIPSDQKKSMAVQLATVAYDSLDLVFRFPESMDIVVKTILIPTFIEGILLKDFPKI